MRTRKWVGAGLMLVGALALLSAAPARADHGVTSDRAAAILVFPNIMVGEHVLNSTGASANVETIVQISNTSNAPVNLHCFYINATSHCSLDSSEACDPILDPCSPSQGLCLPGWIETDFDVVLTPRQPIAWLASNGIANDELPLDGIFKRGIGGSSNAGTRVPPVSEEPYIGELKCIVVDNEGRAVPQNVVKGETSRVIRGEDDLFTINKENAIGILAVEGDANGDNRLELGGGSNEYEGCPSVLIMNHFFDGALNPALADDTTVRSLLTLVPCTQDLLNQVPGGSVVQYLVFNEYEQRFSTSTPMQCYFQRQISTIDTTQPERSIFGAAVAGTLTGQTRMRGVGSGLIGIVQEVHNPDDAPAHTASFNLHLQGDRTVGDVIVLP